MKCNMGNYANSTGNAAVMDGETKRYRSKQVTGFSAYWKANNIYDLRFSSHFNNKVVLDCCTL